MGIWEEADARKASARAASHDKEDHERRVKAEIERKQKATLRELVDGLKARGIQPERFELKYVREVDGIKSYFPKRYLTGWKGPTQFDHILTPEAELRSSLTVADRKKGDSASLVELPMLDSDSDDMRKTKLTDYSFDRIVRDILDRYA